MLGPGAVGVIPVGCSGMPTRRPLPGEPQPPPPLPQTPRCLPSASPPRGAFTVPATSVFSPDTRQIGSHLPQKHVQLFYTNKLPGWSSTAASKYWVRPPRSNVSLTVINIDFVQLKYSYKI